MMPNNRNLGRGRFHSAVSVMQWFILRCETQQKETRPGAAFCYVGGKNVCSGFGIAGSWLDVATSRLCGCRRVPSPL